MIRLYAIPLTFAALGAALVLTTTEKSTACDRAQCPWEVGTPAPAAAAAAPAATAEKPVKLDRFRRQPVARGAASRTVKTGSGEYKNVAIRGRARAARSETRQARRGRPVARPPSEIAAAEAAKPAIQAEDARDAFASVPGAPVLSAEALGARTVEIVSPDEVNRLDLAAGPSPAETTGQAFANWPDNADRFGPRTEPTQVASVVETNSDSGRAVSLDELNRTIAPAEASSTPAPASSDSSWVQRMLIVFGGAFASAAAAARLLMG